MLEKKKITGGLDLDNAKRDMQPGDYPYALNIRHGLSGQNQKGTIVNTKGNKKISYTLPAGENRQIGFYEDKKGSTGIYMVWNSNGEHSILRYFPQTGIIQKILQTPVLNFQKHKRINDIDLFGDMLYWKDVFNHPRKLNIKKSVMDGKKLSFRITFGLKGTGVFKNGDRYDLSFDTPSGTRDAFEFASFTDDAVKDNLTEGSKLFASMFNAHADLQPYFTAHACDEYVEVEAKIEGITRVDIASPVGASARVIYQNIYGDTFIEDFIDAGKYPPLCEPKVDYKADPTRSVNSVQNKAFQFRGRVIFDDDEKSTLGFISIIPIDKGNACGDETSSSKNNYIEIDFTEARLNSKESLCIIKKYELFVREGNLGKWKRIITLEQHQFGIGQNIFKFYNDGIYPVIADVEALLPFSAMPLLANSQEAVENRIAYAGCKDGYNPHCVDGKLKVEYKDSPKPKAYFKVSGRAWIYNIFANNNDYAANQPIHDCNDGGGYVFGGIGKSTINRRFASSHKQNIPLGGWTVYAAGTDYVCVSKQKIGSHGHQNAIGVYDTTTRKRIKKGVRKAIEDRECFSTWELLLPPGRYIIRVASHLTTQADLDDGTRAYQRTSTNLAGIGNNGVNPVTEYEVVITDADVVVPDMAIYDLIDVRVQTMSMALTGYIIENDIPDAPDYFNSKRIELASCRISTDSNWQWGKFLFTPATSLIRAKFFFTSGGNSELQADHNGYFLWAESFDLFGSYTSTVDAAATGVTDLSPTLSLLDGSAFSDLTIGSQQGAGEIILVRSTLTDSQRIPTRTSISGSIKDADGNGIENMSVVNTRGASIQTDDFGGFEIIVYPEIGGTTRTDKLIFSNGDIDCIITIADDTYEYSIVINGSGASGTYKEDKILEIDDLLATVIGQASESAFKRGADYVFAVLYFDDVKRQTTANSNENLKLHINFYTEPIDASENPQKFYPTGQPIVSWELRNAPPDDPNITHWCWARTKNNQLSFHLQWLAKEVAFTTKEGDVTTFESAEFIRFDIVNLADFKSAHPTSILGYTFVKGDRLRLKKNAGNAFYTEYLDYEIVKTDGSFVFIEKQFKLKGIAKGVQFEIYSPKSTTQEQILWEFGEHFEIGTDAVTGKRFHKGLSQDQDPNDPYNKPAKGTFRTGDVYYRLRTFPVEGGHKSDFVDDPNISDYFGFNEQSISRPQTEDKDKRELQRDNIIRLSDKYIPGTAINGLSMFQPLNEVESDRQYGAITKIIIADDKVLLAIHEHNVLPYYIGRANIRDARDLKLLALADEILNESQLLKYNYGCQHPESVVEFNNHVFFLDLFSGKEIRYASNGLFAISDVGMKTWFANKCMRIKASGEALEAVAGYEGLHGQMLLTFNNLNSETNETIGYTEAFEKNRWESFFSFVPEGYGRIGDMLLSFKNGELWKHEQDDVPRNNFYGVQYSRIIDLVFNAIPEGIKMFKNIVLYGRLKEEQCTDITVAPSDSFPNGMKSRLLKNKFENSEGVKYGALMKDLNTPNVQYPIINGRDLRGPWIEFRMENDSVSEQVLEEMHLYSIESPKSNKE